MKLKFLVFSMVLGLLVFGCGSSDDGDTTQEETSSQNRAYALQVLNDDSVPFGAVLHSRDLDGEGKDYSLNLSFNYDENDPKKVDSLKNMFYTNDDGEWFYGEYQDGLPSLLISSEKIYRYGSYTDSSFVLSEFDENNVNIKNTLIESVKFENIKDRATIGLTYKVFSGNWGEIGADDLLGTVGDGLTLFTTCLVPDPTLITKGICVSSLSLSATADLKDITENREAKKVSLVAGTADVIKSSFECTKSMLEAGVAFNKVKMGKAAFDCASYVAGADDLFDSVKEYKDQTKTLNTVNAENNITSTKKPVITDLSNLFEITDTGDIVTTEPAGDSVSGSWSVSENYTASTYTQMSGNLVGEKITQSGQNDYQADITVYGSTITYEYSMNSVSNVLQGLSTGGNSVILKGVNPSIPAIGGTYNGMSVKQNSIELTLTFVDETHMRISGDSNVVLELCNGGICTSMYIESVITSNLTKK